MTSVKVTWNEKHAEEKAITNKHLNDKRSNIFLFENSWKVIGTVGKSRGIVVDVLDGDDDQTSTAAARASAATAAVVCGNDAQSIGYLRFVKRPHQGDDSGIRIYIERPVDQPAICNVTQRRCLTTTRHDCPPPGWGSKISVFSDMTLCRWRLNS